MISIAKTLTKIIDNIRYKKLEVTKVGSSWTSGNIYAYCRAGVVSVHIRGAAIAKLTARTTVASIPAEYAPQAESYATLTASSSIQYFIVGTDGTIKFNAGNAGTFYGTLCYVVGG